MAAGIATLKEIQKPGFYEALDEKSGRLVEGLSQAAQAAGIPFQAGHIGSMAGFFFTEEKVSDFEDAKKSNLENFALFYNGMLQKGIYLAPSQFEAMFISAAHGDDEIDATIQIAADVFKGLA